MHVPAYWPVLLGVQVIEKSGVFAEMKNVIAMESMPIIVLESIDIEELVELAIAIPDIVLVGGIEPVEFVIDMSMAGWACSEWHEVDSFCCF